MNARAPVPRAPKLASCQQACPAGVDVPRYVAHVRAGRFGDALAVVRERIAFPLVCGHACFHPCEAQCGRGQWDQPVAIRMLKRVAAEQGAGAAPALAQRRAATGRRVAIVGSGPCGLTAARELALLGHDVTVFEARALAGGMLRYGIPSYRLPAAALEADLSLIVRCGVRIRTGTRVQRAEALLTEGFEAVLVASGAWRSTKLAIPGAESAHVLDGLAFLSQVSAGEAPLLGPQVVVIGGGNTAIDAARVSRRSGAEVVQLYRRARSDMPADPDEVQAALDEGVHLQFLRAPVRIEAGMVVCAAMAPGPVDASGRARPVPVAGSEQEVPASTVIVAVGQEVALPSGSVAHTPGGTAAVDGATLQTSSPGVFAAGDAVLGPASIIEAIAQGRQAAASIDRFLGGAGVLTAAASAPAAPRQTATAARGTRREPVHMLPVAERLRGFAVVEQPWDPLAARREAGRCLSCQWREWDVAVDAALCKDCGYCHEVCTLGVFDRSDQFNAGGYQPAVAGQPQRCIGCLRCLEVCPEFAITLNPRPCS